MNGSALVLDSDEDINRFNEGDYEESEESAD
ncbi:hypothetical protein TNCV_597671, partial [Trichonephila clavipes]